MTTTPTFGANAAFRAGGLASGIDSNSIVDQLVALQRAPIDKLDAESRAIDVKISALSSLKSKLTAVETSAAQLKQTGARVLKLAAPLTGADVTPQRGASSGSYQLQVSGLAEAAKQRSVGFAAGDTVRGGDLHFDIDGTGYDVAVADGSSLTDVAAAIRSSGAAVSVAVLDDGTHSYLSVTRTSTGHAIGALPGTALAITETSTGTVGAPLGFSAVTQARNATFTVDGLAFERRSNTFSDAVPGASITLKALTAAPERLELGDDTDGTKASMQGFVDALNGVLKELQSELDIKAETDRSRTLAGDATLRFAQTRLKALVSSAFGAGSVRTLADLGVKSERDGTLSVDAAAFDKAMKRDPAALDTLFRGGLEARVNTVVEAFANASTGALSLSAKQMAEKKNRIEDQKAQLSLRADKYKEQLIAQFTAMEKVVSGLNATGNFLTSQENRVRSSNG